MDLILSSHNGFPRTFAFHYDAFDGRFDHLIKAAANEYFTHAAKRQDTIEISPHITATDTEKAFEIEADLPGVIKENLKILVDGKRVTIEAEVKRMSERRNGEQVLKEERTAKKFSSTFLLSSDVDEARAIAKLENGVLSLTLPKKKIPQARRILVQ